MSPTSPAINLVHLPLVTSTMDILDDLIAVGAPPWTVVLADEQTAGVGRGGRTWEAEPGSALLCSILVRPKFASERSGLLAMAVGVALAQFLEMIGATVQLKWPNDVLLDGRKLAGILIRARVDSKGEVANVGIGANLLASSSDGKSRAALSECSVEIPAITEIVTGVVQNLAGMLSDEDTSTIRDAWMDRAAFMGESVDVGEGTRRIAGVMRGIDHSGAIQIEGEDGLIDSIAAGDLVRGPRLGAG